MGHNQTNHEQGSNNDSQNPLDEFFDLEAGELHETITFLIAHREQLLDEELERLEEESRHLIDSLGDINRQKLLVEIRCFKEILALQKRLIEEDAGQHH